MLLGKLLPREGDFFELFNQHAACITEGARAFQQMVTGYDNAQHREEQARAVDDAERRADKITAEVNRMLHRTFITPLDREQIHALINAMDDVLDILQDVTEMMALYDVHEMTEDIKRLTELSVRACERVAETVHMLNKLRDQATVDAALKACEEIDRLESDADRVMRSALSRLFREQEDVRELIKHKALYEQLECITDRCEDVANEIEGIVLENS